MLIRKWMKMHGKLEYWQYGESRWQRGNREKNVYRKSKDNWDHMEIRKCMENISDVWKVGKMGNLRKYL